MAAKRKRFVTPVGKIIFPWIIEPRDYQGNGKFAYSCSLDLEGEDAAQLAALVDAEIEEARARFNTNKVFSTPYGPATDRQKEEIPGVTRFKFKVGASAETKNGQQWDRKPTLVDCDRNPIVAKTFDDLPLGAGSLVRIAFTPYPWKNPGGVGVTLQPVAVQVLELVRFVDDSASAFDDSVKGSFKAEAPREETPEETDEGYEDF